MKKYIFGFVVLVSLLAAGCSDNPLPDDGTGKAEVRPVDPIGKVSVNSDWLSEVDSFYDADNDYYMFTMGMISNVPLETPVFFYYGGTGEIEQKFTRTSTTVSSISTTVQNMVREQMSWKLSSEVSASVELDDILKSSVSSKISGSTEVDKTTTETQSYAEFNEWANTSEKSMSITFNERYRAGYYAYLVSATVKVRVVLVKNRATGTVKVGTYNELVSHGYSFAYNEFNNTLPVDKSQKLKFDMPDIDSLPAPTEAVGFIRITSVQEFNKISGNLSGKYVLLNDLDFKGDQITPIGGSDGTFTGIINGNGHTIRNFSVSADGSCAGLIARNAGRIENIRICNAHISVDCTAKNALAGVVAGENTGILLNCSVSDSSVQAHAADSNNTEGSSRYAIAGGVAGKISAGTIRNCSVENVSLYGYAKKHDKAWSDGWSEAAFVYLGGIAGEQADGAVLDNTARSLEIEGSAEYRSNAFAKAATRSRICIGGIIGRQADSGLTQSGNTSNLSESSVKKTFKSYNELVGGVNSTEDYQWGNKVGSAG